MELKFYGANCFRITTKKANLVIDDNLKALGGQVVAKAGDIILATSDDQTARTDAELFIDQPGEYEVSDISIQGIAAKSHMESADKMRATIYKIVIDDIRLAILGHVSPDLDDKQLEALGTIDVLLIPVGGNGYTLDGVDALKVIKKVEPKIIIPTHYNDKGLNYPVPQQTLEDAIKELAMEPGETVPKLKLKAGEVGEAATRLVVLERQ